MNQTLCVVAYESLKTKEKSSWVIPKVVAVPYGSGHLRELFIKVFEWHFKQGFTKVLVVELVAYESGHKESVDCTCESIQWWKEYVTIAVNHNLSNCKNSPKKDFRGFNGIWTCGLWVSAAVLSQLSYEDPYTGGWPVYWVFFRLFSQLLKLRFTAMVTYSFHLYSRSSHHFIQCFIPFTSWWTQ